MRPHHHHSSGSEVMPRPCSSVTMKVLFACSRCIHKLTSDSCCCCTSAHRSSVYSAFIYSKNSKHSLQTNPAPPPTPPRAHPCIKQSSPDGVRVSREGKIIKSDLHSSGAVPALLVSGTASQDQPTVHQLRQDRPAITLGLLTMTQTGGPRGDVMSLLLMVSVLRQPG